MVACQDMGAYCCFPASQDSIVTRQQKLWPDNNNHSNNDSMARHCSMSDLVTVDSKASDALSGSRQSQRQAPVTHCARSVRQVLAGQLPQGKSV